MTLINKARNAESQKARNLAFWLLLLYSLFTQNKETQKMTFDKANHIAAVAKTASQIANRSTMKEARAYIEFQTGGEWEECAEVFALVLKARTKLVFSQLCAGIETDHAEKANVISIERKARRLVVVAAEKGLSISEESAHGYMSKFGAAGSVYSALALVIDDIEAARAEAEKIIEVARLADCDTATAAEALNGALNMTEAVNSARHAVIESRKGSAWRSAESSCKAAHARAAEYEISGPQLGALVSELEGQGVSFEVRIYDYTVVLCAGLRGDFEPERAVIIANTNAKRDTATKGNRLLKLVDQFQGKQSTFSKVVSMAKKVVKTESLSFVFSGVTGRIEREKNQIVVFWCGQRRYLATLSAAVRKHIVGVLSRAGWLEGGHVVRT
jgi:hypothetical protein